jgi:predicted ATPase
MSRTKITTISGAIGVGKSTVLDILRKRDFNVVPSVGKTEGTVQKILQMKYLDEFTT